MRLSVKNIFATFGAWSIEILSWIASTMPTTTRYKFAASLGFAFGMLARRMRKSLQDNLRFLLHMEHTKIARISDSIFQNFGMTLCDFFIPGNVTISASDEHKAKLEQIRAEHGGILVLTFHMGHWELGARVMREWGWPVTAVYQPYTNKKFKAMIEARRAPGVNFLPVGGKAAGGVREALKRGDVVAMLGDHPFGEEGTPVNLMGHRVMWPKGPVLLAVREKCPIVIAVVVRSKPGHYVAHIEDALVPRAKSRAEVQRLVQEVTDKFAKFLRQYPTQWYRFRGFEFVE